MKISNNYSSYNFNEGSRLASSQKITKNAANNGQMDRVSFTETLHKKIESRLEEQKTQQPFTTYNEAEHQNGLVAADQLLENLLARMPATKNELPSWMPNVTPTYSNSSMVGLVPLINGKTEQSKTYGDVMQTFLDVLDNYNISYEDVISGKVNLDNNSKLQESFYSKLGTTEYGSHYKKFI